MAKFVVARSMLLFLDRKRPDLFEKFYIDIAKAATLLQPKVVDTVDNSFEGSCDQPQALKNVGGENRVHS